MSYSAAAQSGVEFVDELTDEEASQMVSSIHGWQMPLSSNVDYS